MLLRQALSRVTSASSTSTSTSASLAAARLLIRASSSASREAAAGAIAAAAKAAGSEPPPPPRRGRWLLFLPPAAAAFLCHWQLERRDWKARLLEERGKALRGEPLSLEELLSALRRDRGGGEGGGEGGGGRAAPRPREMARVVVGVAGSGSGGGEQGEFVFDRSSTLLVGPRPRSFGGSTVGGSLVVTPLLRRRGEGEGGNEGALVVRGWVPSGWREERGGGEGGGGGLGPAARRGEEEGLPRRGPPPPPPPPPPPLLCVLRSSESPSRFVPENDPSKGIWHWVDAAAMAASVGLPREGTPLLEIVAGAGDAADAAAFSASPSSSSRFGDGGFGAREEEEGERQKEAKKKKERPSLMEVLGGRTAERGSGSPPVGRPPPPSLPALRPTPKQPRPQPRSLEEISQVLVSPGQHLQYAVTWGTLAVATAALAVKVGRKGRGRGRHQTR